MDNSIISEQINFSIENIQTSVDIKGNNFSQDVSVQIDELKSKDDVEWAQFMNKMNSSNSYNSYVRSIAKTLLSHLDTSMRKELKTRYLDSVRYYEGDSYANEIALKGLFYNYYRNKYNTETANHVYLELKDFETKRLEILHKQNPGFRTYFKWKVNQFLKLFSNYGTEPSKAIVVSLYVIFFFALIYLFFPNSWDSHGKNRMVDRYNFFFKYMKRNAGINEVYLEDQRDELMSYEQFKSNITNSQQKVPRFFTATALPLYRWAISGTRITSTFLKRVDVMKGSWEDVPEDQRWFKGFLLIGAFTIAIVYDLMIKMLNALMLSINTFTTLGFGEIPIKGLPRYLAIIQGFIGWFMLTIFSVSLISQLLN